MQNFCTSGKSSICCHCNWPLTAPQGNCPSSLNCAASTPHWGPSTEKRGRHFPFFHQSLKTKPRTNLSLLQIVLTLTPWPPQAVWTSRHPLPTRWTHPFRAAPGFEHLATITLTSPQGASGVPDASSGPEEAPVFRKAGTFHQGQVDQHPLRPSEREDPPN